MSASKKSGLARQRVSTRMCEVEKTLRKRVHAREQHCKVQKNGVVTLAGDSTLYY